MQEKDESRSLNVGSGLGEEESKFCERRPPEMPVKAVARTDVTYFKFIQDALEEWVCHDSEDSEPKRGAYTLAEDLKLIIELCKRGMPVKSSVFDDLASIKFIHRSSLSMQNRYKDILCLVGENEIQRVVDHIGSHGLQGFMTKEDKKILITLTLPDILTHFQEDSGSSGSQILQIRLIEKPIFKTQEEKDAQDLSRLLLWYQQTMGIKRVDLLTLLDRMSGDPIVLDQFLQTKDESVIWSEQEDCALRDADPVAIRVLERHKGQHSVALRREYLAIV